MATYPTNGSNPDVWDLALKTWLTETVFNDDGTFKETTVPTFAGVALNIGTGAITGLKGSFQLAVRGKDSDTDEHTGINMFTDASDYPAASEICYSGDNWNKIIRGYYDGPDAKTYAIGAGRAWRMFAYHTGGTDEYSLEYSELATAEGDDVSTFYSFLKCLPNSGFIVVNENAQDLDVRVEGTSGKSNLFRTDAATGRVGIMCIPNAVFEVLGDCRFGDQTTNYLSVGSTGNLSFVGSAEFHPRRIRQSSQPSPSAGELLIWSDSDDDAVRFVYNDADAGAVTVLLS